MNIIKIVCYIVLINEYIKEKVKQNNILDNSKCIKYMICI